MSTPTTEKPDVQNVRMPVRYTFTDSEIAELAKKGVQFARAYESLEKDFTSIKADYKLRLTNLENERDRLDEKIADGFEMRDTACVCAFNTPTKGQKTFTREDTGELVRVEAMSHFDLEKEFDLKTNEEKQREMDLAVAGIKTTRTDAKLPDNTTDDHVVGGYAPSDQETSLGTNLGNVLTSTAAKTDQPQVVLPDWDKEDWGAKSLRVAFKKAADKAGWPKVAIETLLSQCKGSDVAAIRATLAPHVKGASSVAFKVGAEYDETFGPFDGKHHVSCWGFIEPLKVSTDIPSEMHETRKLELISEDMTNAAITANWPDAAKQYLAHCIDGATLEELVALSERLKGGSK